MSTNDGQNIPKYNGSMVIFTCKRLMTILNSKTVTASVVTGTEELGGMNRLPIQMIPMQILAQAASMAWQGVRKGTQRNGVHHQA